MESPDCEFDDFLDGECGVFVNGYADGRFDLRINTVEGEFFVCVPEGEFADFMRNFFSGNGANFL